MSDGGAATKLREVGHGDIHVTDDKPTLGLLFDASGKPVKKTGIIARMDDKGAETVTLRKSTIWAVAVVPAILAVLFSYGSAAIGWARDDQKQKEALIQFQSTLERIEGTQNRQEQKWEKLDERLRESERFIDRVGGYRAKEGETPNHGK